MILVILRTDCILLPGVLLSARVNIQQNCSAGGICEDYRRDRNNDQLEERAVAGVTSHGGDFVGLTEEQQDGILTDMDEDTATGFEGPAAKAFFTQLRNDTIEGMFADPMYGGNRDLVGWKLIGYPGAQRYYSADDLKQPGTNRQPQSLAQLLEVEGH